MKNQGAPARTGAPWFLVAAAALGIFAQVAAPIPILLNLTTYMGTWVTLVVLSGRRAPSSRAAASTGLLVLMVAVAAFYATRAVQQGGSLYLPLLFFWAALAIPVGPVIGLLGYFSRQTYWRGAVALSLLAGLLCGEALRVAWHSVDPARWSIVVFDLLSSAFLFVGGDLGGGLRMRALALLPVTISAGVIILATIPLLLGLFRV
jgi:hypothetical protein